MLQVVENLFQLWNDNGVVYCSWKGNSHIEDAMNGTSDFDILVSANSIENSALLLKKAGYMLCITQPDSRYPGVQDWIGVDTETGTMIHIHLHQFMIAGHSGVMEYILPWNDIAFSTRHLNDEYNIYMMNPSLEILLLFTRLGIEHSSRKLKKTHEGWVLKEKTQIEISYLKERIDRNLTLELAKELFPACFEAIMRLIEKEVIDAKDIEQLTTVTKKTCAKWSRYSITKTKFLILLKYFKKVAVRKWNKSMWRGCITKKVPTSGKGVSIAFIGQDGCGKSTVTHDIEAWLNWKIDAHRFYLGSGDHYNGTLKRFLSKAERIKRSGINAHEGDKVITELKKNKRRKKSLKNFLVAFLVSQNHINVVKRAYKEVRLSESYRSKGGIPLFDRFPQNQFEGIYDGPKIATYIDETGLDYWLIRLLSKKEKKYINKIQQYQPQLIFKLLLPPEESIRRKPFEDLQAVTLKHEITKSLFFANSKILLVDATQDYQKELIFIKKEIWEAIITNQ